MTWQVWACVWVLVTLGQTALGAENWSRFRGPNGTGVSEETGFPVTWTDKDYAWKVKIPGYGHSSPCVWGEHLFLTAASEDGRKRRFMSFRASTGQRLWLHETEAEAEKLYPSNSYASATPTTDGKRVYLAFASGHTYRMVAFDFHGQLKWSVNLGHFENGPKHGFGTSPIVFEDTVILVCTQEKNSFVVALDSRTGKERWRAKRAGSLTSHSTPFLFSPAGEPELFWTGGDGIGSLNPRSGKMNWREDVLPSRVVASPVYGHGLVFGTGGGQGKGRVMAAVRMVKTAGQKRVVWTRKRQLPHVPTLLVHGEYIYLWGDAGIVACLNAQRGETVWTQRLGGVYYGSPIWLEGRLYCVSEDGEVVVINAGAEFRVLGRTSLGEGSHGTPAVAGGRMFLRGFEHLFCLKAK